MIHSLPICDFEESEYLKTITNGGSQLYKQLGKLVLFLIEIHYKSEPMDNIISFKDVASIPGVFTIMDIDKESTITVTLKEEQV